MSATLPNPLVLSFNPDPSCVLALRYNEQFCITLGARTLDDATLEVTTTAVLRGIRQSWTQTIVHFHGYTSRGGDGTVSPHNLHEQRAGR